ncbi:hypothetical protein [Rahnella laticis]|uniref:hypothetical protein n=1 Tax=Rahnella laticis TaxID=2787622 RepID=UPI0018A250F0|nr:hypothetical protein [Rahnella laticis]MBF7996659.1 hypothetical protein [Rahnella laticis]
MIVYPDYVDSVAINIYESNLLPDIKAKAPEKSKQELDDHGVFFDSSMWNEQISIKDVMGRLIFDERMAHIWPAITKRGNDFRVPTAFYFSLCSEIAEIFSGPDDWSLLTPNEKTEKLERITKLALALSSEIANTPLDSSVMGYVNQEFYFNYFKSKSDEEKNRKIDYALDIFCQLEDKHYKSKENLDVNGVVDVWSVAGVAGPSVSSLLQDVYIKAKEVKYDSVLKRKNKIKRAYFIRRLTAFFQKHFGSQLYNITAAISSVFLEEEITIEEVRSTIR